jgi:hypothetical protein
MLHELKQVVVQGVSGCLDTRIDRKLAIDRAHMGIDGKMANDKFFCNLSVG